MLTYKNHALDPAACAQSLKISTEAVQLYLNSEVVDLHIDSFIWNRFFGYDLSKHHGQGLFGRSFYGQVDFPRILEAQLSGATWIITTNPVKSAAARARAFVENQSKLLQIFQSNSSQFAVVRNISQYEQARAAGKHAAFIGIQGGNALDDGLEALDLIEDDVVIRITLVHQTNSSIGYTSTPTKIGEGGGLTSFGKDYVRRLNEKRILVDLAHINRAGFFDAVQVHEPSLPFVVTHTGVSGAYKHWRNIDDDQLRAVAKSGGTVGIMYQASFLGDKKSGRGAEVIVDHLEHTLKTIGEDHVSLGSDWDGAITTPWNMPTCLELPKLVQLMLDRRFSETAITKILGSNFLRVVADIRGRD
jgi:membrane dipeptidase